MFPKFCISDPTTTLHLISVAPDDGVYLLNMASFEDLPKQEDTPAKSESRIRQVAHYSFCVHSNEEYVAPESLTFINDGRRFLAGTRGKIGVFDVERPESEPSDLLQFAPNARGIASTLSLSSATSNPWLAMGTTARDVAVYSQHGLGDEVASFNVARACSIVQDGETIDIGGSGITQVKWSPDGTYLYVAEGQSDGLLIYDVRVQGRCLAVLNGRKATSKQPMGFDVLRFGAEGGRTCTYVYAGGADGVVRCWRDPHLKQGLQEPSTGLKAHDGLY